MNNFKLMTPYNFETDQLGISDNGFHFLRSKYNYETIDFSDVVSISIEKGRQVNNWIVLFVFGMTLFSFGMIWASKAIYEFFFADNINRFYVEQFVLPVLPILLGGFSTYISLKRGFVIVLTTRTKFKRFPIERLKKENKLSDLIFFLKTSDMTKDKVSIRSEVVGKK